VQDNLATPPVSCESEKTSLVGFRGALQAASDWAAYPVKGLYRDTPLDVFPHLSMIEMRQILADDDQI
jgi:hypothetical protein